MNGTFRIERLLRPFRALWYCASQTQGDALIPYPTLVIGETSSPQELGAARL